MNPRTLGFLQCGLGIGALSGMDAVVKHLGSSHDVSVITLARYTAGTLLALIIWQWQGRPRITREMLPVHLLRGAMIAAMAFTFYWSLTRLTLAEAITIAFIAPLLVPPMAALVLGEQMQARFLAAGALGFIGVLVTMQGAPVFAGDRLLAVGAVLFSAITYAAGAVLLRARAKKDGATLITLLGALIPALLLSPVAIGQPVPGMTDIGWFLAMGLIGNVGIQLLARGYVHLEAQAAAVMEFTGLPWAALFGWLFFAEPVRPQIWAGAAIILAACIWASRGPQKVPA